MSRSVARRTSPQQFQRETNLALVLRTLRERGSASRSELALAIGIDRSTMTSIAGELLAAGLLTEAEGESGTRGGRKRQNLSLAADRVISAGIDLDDERALWEVCSLAGETLATGVVRRNAGEGLSPWLTRMLDRVHREVVDWSSAAAGPPPLLAGVGIGVPGLYDPERRVLRESVVLDCRDLDLAGLRYGTPPVLDPVIDNDANCCAWNIADAPDGGTTIFVQLKLHRSDDGGFRDSVAGVGLSFVMDGRVYYGSSHAAGELKGYRWKHGNRDQLGLQPAAEVSVAQIVRELLKNLGVVASAFDPSRIVLGGDLPELTGEIGDAIDGELAGAAVAPLYHTGVLEIAGPGEYGVSRGAARMVLHELFALPQVQGTEPHRRNWRSIIDQLLVSTTIS